MSIFKYELGWLAKDTITGWTGRIVIRSEHLTGCVQYVLVPTHLDKDGKRIDGEWFDEVRLEILERAAPMKADQAKPGGEPVKARFG